MKAKIFLLVFAVFISTQDIQAKQARAPCTTPAPCTTTTARPLVYCPDCVNSACTTNACNQAVHLPFPGDCTKFCQCDFNGAVSFDCPDGLYFNAQLQVCDWPESSGCTVDNTYVGSCTAL